MITSTQNLVMRNKLLHTINQTAKMIHLFTNDEMKEKWRKMLLSANICTIHEEKKRNINENYNGLKKIQCSIHQSVSTQFSYFLFGICCVCTWAWIQIVCTNRIEKTHATHSNEYTFTRCLWAIVDGNLQMKYSLSSASDIRHTLKSDN